MSKAQGEFITSGLFSQLGEAQSDFVVSGNMTRLEKVLSTYAVKVIKEAQKNLKKSNSIDTGALNKVIFEVQQDGTKYNVVIGYYANSPASKYFDYVNKGVKGLEGNQNTPYKFKTRYASKKMITAILKWIRRNGIKPTETKKLSKLERKKKSIRAMVEQSKGVKIGNRLTTDVGLATAISRNIKKKGLKSTHYLDDAMKLFNTNDFKNKVQNIVKQEINISIQSTWVNRK